MRNNFLSSLITLSVVVYAIKHIVYRLLFSIKPLKQFYTNRMVLPSVKVWDNKILHAAYNHIYSVLETLIFTMIFLLVHDNIFVLKNSFAMLLIYLIVVIQTKVSFSSLLSMYPKSLLIFNIIIDVILTTTEYITLYFVCIKFFPTSF